MTFSPRPTGQHKSNEPRLSQFTTTVDDVFQRYYALLWSFSGFSGAPAEPQTDPARKKSKTIFGIDRAEEIEIMV